MVNQHEYKKRIQRSNKPECTYLCMTVPNIQNKHGKRYKRWAMCKEEREVWYIEQRRKFILAVLQAQCFSNVQLSSYFLHKEQSLLEQTLEQASLSISPVFSIIEERPKNINYPKTRYNWSYIKKEMSRIQREYYSNLLWIMFIK